MFTRMLSVNLHLFSREDSNEGWFGGFGYSYGTEHGMTQFLSLTST